MAGLLPYDMLREGGSEVPDLRAEADRDREAAGLINPEVFLDSIPVQSANNPTQAAYLQKMGYVSNGKGGFVDPERIFAQDRKLRYDRLEQQMKQRQEQIANSMLFKVGDTLADTGRIFLSPLFWLKGEDQSQYDPSDRLKTGYRNQFTALEELRAASVQKFTTARDVRLAATRTFENNRANQLIQSMSPFERELQNFAAGEGLLDMYKDPKQREALTQKYRVRKGEAIQFGDTIIDAKLHNTVLGRAEKFETSTASYRDAMMGFSSLKASLGSNSAIGNIAAVFTFMKTLDPNSVVREGEYQLAAQAGSLYTKLMAMFEKAKTGKVIQPEVAKEMLEVAGQIAALYEDKYNEKRGRYATEFSKYQYSDDDIRTLLGDEVSLNLEDDEGTTTPQSAEVVIDDITDPAGLALSGYLEPTEQTEVLPNGQ